MVAEKFQIMVLRLLANTFTFFESKNQKMESAHFYSYSPLPSKVSIITPQAKGNYPFLQNSVF